MGLLDDFAGFIKTPEGQGLLSGAAGWAAGARRGTPWNNIGRGGLAGIAGYGNALEQQQQAAQAAQMAELRKMQLEQLKKQNKTKDLLDAALREQVSTPASMKSQEPYGGGYSPAVSAAFGLPVSQNTKPMQPPVASSFADNLMAAAIKAGDSDAYQKAYALKLEEKKLNPKFATDVRVVMKNGVPTAVQMADDGTVREMTGMTPAEKLHFADNGSYIQGLNQFTGAPVGGAIKKTMTPDAVASNTLGWANYNKPSIQNVEGIGMLSVGPKGTATPVTMGGKPVVQDKPMNGEQAKAALFADMMAASEKIMSDPKLANNQKPEKGAEFVKAIPSMGLGGKIGNQLETSDRQKVRQAQETWVRAALRLESGAVIGPEEMAQEIRTYFPQTGDSAEVIDQKATLRNLKQRGIAREAGSAYKPMSVSGGRSSGGVIDFSQLRP